MEDELIQPDEAQEHTENSVEKAEEVLIDEGAEEKTSYGLIRARSIDNEMSESYLDYAMSVIVSRALPDVRDGLKPVHRRILYTMRDMNLMPTAKHQKSAKIVGQVLGLYHPHGDQAVYLSMVRMAQWWSMRLPLVDGQGNFGCFTKDTKVMLTDGRNLSFEDLVMEDKLGKKNFTYTVNKLGMISVSQILNPRMTRTNAELIEVILDNGSKIRCTHDHKFMLKDGSYKPASQLSIGESLMPLYMRLSTNEDRFNRAGYQQIYQNKTDEWVPAHHLADNFNLTNHEYTKEKGRVRHHIDFNKLNNNPENITRMSLEDHWKIHYLRASVSHDNQEYREKLAKGRNIFWSNPENRKKYSVRMSLRNRTNWQDPAYREHMSEFLSKVNKEHFKNHPELRQEISKRATVTLKRLWQDPTYKQLFHDTISASNKARLTNLTGEKKFLNVCKEVLREKKILSREWYEKKRKEIYGYGAATGWDTGIKKYFNDNTDLILFELNKNHRVVSVKYLTDLEDVYDLTISGSHNFALADGVFVHNSMDGDSPAAMRYTEARLASPCDAILLDIEKETVDFRENYDGTTTEPVVLPTRLPNLLINGSQGIAVGMATNIPTHNPTEVIDSLLLMQKNPNATVDEIIEVITGPDFPTGGIAYNIDDIKEAFSTGRGRVIVRGRASIEEDKKREVIIITELPYQVNKADFIRHIADLVRVKKIEGIHDIRDESDRKDGVRVVIELKLGAPSNKILNQLYDLTELQTVVHYNMVALIDGIQPKLLTLPEILLEFLSHRTDVVTRRTIYELKVAKARAHILEGLKIALDHLDAIIKLIRESSNRDSAKNALIETFKLSEIQANAILDMRLSQLANLERQRIYDEYEAILKVISDLEDILAKPERVETIVRDELLEIKEKYPSKRLTEIRPEALGQLTAIDLIAEEDVLISLTANNYVKRLTTDTYKNQSRGGKGVIGMTMREDDAVLDMVYASSHDDIIFFTDKGRAFKIKAYEIPVSSRQSKGVALPNVIKINGEEKVTELVAISSKTSFEYFFFATAKGVVKRVAKTAFDNVRKTGVTAVGLKDNDKLVWVKRTSGKDEIAQITKHGQVIMYNEEEVRSMGRNAAGVRGINLRGGDEVIETAVLNEQSYAVCILSENGIGKKVAIKEFRNQHRGGSGIRIAKLTPKTGDLVAGSVVDSNAKDMIIATTSGQIIRIPVESVKQLSRQASGVILIRMNGDAKVSALTIVDESQEQDLKGGYLMAEKVIQIPDEISVRSLSSIINQQPTAVITKLISNGIMANINQNIDFTTASLLAEEFGYTAEPEKKTSKINKLFSGKDTITRPPIVTIMGHVDHGKTSLLDYIRKENVAAGESGGITQHISAYQIDFTASDSSKRKITFVDTPGHEAFSALRLHGATLTDIVIIVVSADDGVKPQTIEAIKFAREANTQIIVAINKTDLPNANIERVKQQLADNELVPEEWGGKTVMIPVSAKTGEGVNALLEMIVLTADLLELKADPDATPEGIVIEGNLDKQIGPLAIALVYNGTLHTGQVVVVGKTYGRIRALEDDKNEKIANAGPSKPVRVIGLKDVPNFGDYLVAVPNEKVAKSMTQSQIKAVSGFDEDANTIKIVLKADVGGSLAALEDSIRKLSYKDAKVDIISSGIGAVTENDITFAKTAGALVISFRVPLASRIVNMSVSEKVFAKDYWVIYDIIDYLQAELKRIATPVFITTEIGRLKVMEVFSQKGSESIVGGEVLDGEAVKNHEVTIIRNKEEVGKARVGVIKIGKVEASPVLVGQQCGLSITESTITPEKGDIITFIEITEEK